MIAMIFPRRNAPAALLVSILLVLGLASSACSAASTSSAGGRVEQNVPTSGSISDSTNSSASATWTTVVSITFDDGSASQYSTLAMLQAHGMVATYYVNSGLVGSGRYYMTWPKVHQLATMGNEIGGHTLDHVNLTHVDPDSARSQVCDDRTNLVNEGFPATSFAYPEASVNTAALEEIVKGCGYSSGRGVGNLYGDNCECPYAESVPPHDPYKLRTANGVTIDTTLADLQRAVVGAEEHGGGWVTFAFHGICADACTQATSLSPEIFLAFLDWLEPRSGIGTVVRTVGQVMETRPAGPAG